MMRLMFGKPRKNPTHALEPGELCMALPVEVERRVGEGSKYFLATVVDFKKRMVIFFDDGSESEVEVAALSEATRDDREAAKAVYGSTLSECKTLLANDPEEIISAAIAKVKAQMGGTLGDDGMISYTQAAGEEMMEGQLFLEALLQNFGAIAKQSPAIDWMRSHWQEVCAEHDMDSSGTISDAEAASIWAQMAMTISEFVAAKLDVLGAPARLYRGDLCLASQTKQPLSALPAGAGGDLGVWVSTLGSDPGPSLATYMSSTQVVFLDGDGKVENAVGIAPASAAAKEKAILRYTMAVAQLKAIARRPSKQLVREAIDKVRAAMGGTLGKDAAISYTQEAGDEAREGQLLCAALMENIGALKTHSRAAAAVAANWQVACAQADEDGSGTITPKEAVAIWDRILLETMRAMTSKLDKLGVYPLPLLLEKGDFCMVRCIPSEASVSDPQRLYLATYVDTTHAIFFDDGTDEVREVSSVGPATEADKDVYVVKYMKALDQCTQLAGYDEQGVVTMAIEDVKKECGGKLGPNGEIDYTESAGDEAKEGKLLVEALLSNLGALWDEAPSLRYMMSHWREVCKELDVDGSGTISEEEAVQIWDKVLSAFRMMVLRKLQLLGVVERMVARINNVVTGPLAA